MKGSTIASIGIDNIISAGVLLGIDFIQKPDDKFLTTNGKRAMVVWASIGAVLVVAGAIIGNPEKASG